VAHLSKNPCLSLRHLVDPEHRRQQSVRLLSNCGRVMAPKVRMANFRAEKVKLLRKCLWLPMLKEKRWSQH